MENKQDALDFHDVADAVFYLKHKIATGGDLRDDYLHGGYLPSKQKENFMKFLMEPLIIE
jgi:hypothetical protein